MKVFFLTQSINSKAFNWIQYVFEDHAFKSEYLFLLEIGALIGYILGIIFMFLMQFIQLERISKQGIHGIYLLMTVELLITFAFLSLTIFSLSIELLAISFIMYILFSIFIDRMKDRYLFDDDFKHTHPKQIL
ncbi:hypothetical protein BK011_06055 [Tenericutes bacterium MZ-XQ]|nr:hypothetical protein BK011_06055 [Tenericutes bacterium MZ-XQ]